MEFTTLTVTANGGSGVFVSYIWDTPNGIVDQGGSNILNVMETGTYALTVEDDKGCPGIAVVDVFVHPNPDAGLTIIPDQLDICPGSDPLLIVSAPFYTDPDGFTTEYQFSWEVPAGFGDDPSGSGFQNTFETDVPGIYSLTITDDFGCEVDTTFEIVMNDAPDANSAIIGDCYDPDGTGLFDLTTLYQEINPDPDVTISFFTDFDLNNEILDPENYEGPTGVIYAVVMDDTCPSEPVEILLVFEAEIVVNDAMLESCITGNNQGLFNLVPLNSTINNDPGISIVWYSNPDTTDLIIDPANFMSGPTTVYAVALNSMDCRSRAAEVELTLVTDLQAAPASLTACNEGNGIGTFDITSLTSIVQNGNGAAVIWYTDATLTTEVSDPSSYQTATGTLYAVLQDIDGCLSAPEIITLTVETTVDGTALVIDECDLGDNTGNFDLTAANSSINGGAGVVFSWYTDSGLTNPISDPTNFNAGPGQVFVQLQDGVCISDPVAIDLTVSQTLAAFDAAIDECDPGTGIGNFDLTIANSSVNGGSGNTVNYYLDMAGTMPITDPTNFDTTNNTIIYAQVIDQGCVSNFVEITLTVSINTPAFDAMLMECDQGSGSGSFDLTTANNTVTGGDPSLTVTYYLDMAGTMPVF